jgi:hypothetical protein
LFSLPWVLPIETHLTSDGWWWWGGIRGGKAEEHK